MTISSAELVQYTEAMAHSKSTVAQATAKFLLDVASVKSFDTITSLSIPNIRALYSSGEGSHQLCVRSAQIEKGYIAFSITDEGKFYLLFSSPEADADIHHVYEGFTVNDPERFSPDRRFLTLEIDANAPEIAAKPAALLTDTYESGTRASIGFQYFIPTDLELMQSLVEKLLVALNGEYFQWKKDSLTLRKPIEQKDVPSY